MMTFFTFFFSGPGWGWRVLALMCLLNVVIEIIPRIINTILDYRLKKYKIEMEWIDDDKKNTNDGTPATIDDVRS